MKKIFIVILLLTISCLKVLANEQVLADKNILKIDNFNGKKVIIIVNVGRPHDAQCSNWGWGAENRCPKAAILSIVLTVDGEPAFIRKSAFSDLASPKELFFAKDKEKLYLTIKGGDAAESYMAILRFSQTGLEYRKVASREFPDDAWEESFYAYPVFD